MKSTLLIFTAAALSSALCATAAERYSLWPRRPAEIEQARQLIKERRPDEAVRLLLPLVGLEGIAGREARQLVGVVNAPVYLSLRHPAAAVYTVRRGDHLTKVASSLHCPYELLMLLNGIVDPGAIHVGQRLVYVPMQQRVEINLPRREITVWNGELLVSSYNITGVEETYVSGMADQDAAVTQRDGYVDGSKVPAWSPLMICSDRRLTLSNGIIIAADSKAAGLTLCMAQTDLNELALLVTVGTPVHIVKRAADIPEASQGQAWRRGTMPGQCNEPNCVTLLKKASFARVHLVE